MGIKKGITLGAAALALNAAEAKTSDISEILKEKTKKEIKQTIEAEKTPTSDIHREDAMQNFNNKPLKNQGEIDKIIERLASVDSTISDINIDPKLKYAEFVYKNKYKIKYEPKSKPGDPGRDIITITDTTTQSTYKMEVYTALFLKDRQVKYKKAEIQNGKIIERLECVTTVFNAIHEKIDADSTLTHNKDEIVYIKNNKIYFLAEKKGEKKGKEDREECYFRIDYKPGTPATYTIVEIKPDTFFDNSL